MTTDFLNKLRESAFWHCLILYVVFLPFSEAFVSVASGFLLFQALILASWNHPSVPKKAALSLFTLPAIFLVYVIGISASLDFSFAVYELKKVVFWLVIPLAFFLSPRLSLKKYIIILLLFCLSVFAASLFGLVRLIFMDYFHIESFRQIILVSHIRYSFQLNLAILAAAWIIFSPEADPFRRFRLPLAFLLVWLVVFLVLLKSITGIIAFAGTVVFLIILVALHLKRTSHRFFILGILVTLFILPLLYISKVWSDFYRSEAIPPSAINEKTLSGNPYSFDLNSKERENGHWVRAYVCEEELRREWNKRSHFGYDSIDRHGYPYSAALIRYMTSKGMRKDSASLSLLSDRDIRAVENGIANHIFIDRKFSLYPRIYETIWELDRYRNSGDANFQSVSQRIEFYRASLHLIKKRPIFGIGTGNWRIRYAEAYSEMNSTLIPKNQGPSHNQYLNYLVKFGITGFIFILAMLVIPLFSEGHKRNLLFWSFLVSMAFANLGDANFETHMGLSFFCFFYCFFLWHTPSVLRISFPWKGHQGTS